MFREQINVLTEKENTLELNIRELAKQLSIYKRELSLTRKARKELSKLQQQSQNPTGEEFYGDETLNE